MAYFFYPVIAISLILIAGLISAKEVFSHSQSPNGEGMFLERNTSVYFNKQLPNNTKKSAGRNLQLKCEAVFVSNDKQNSNNTSKDQGLTSSSDRLKKLKVYWLKNDVSIVSVKDRIVIKKIFVNDSIISGLKISNIKAEDEGLYTCVLGNSFHEVRSSTRLVVINDLNEKKGELPTYEPLYPKSIESVDISSETASTVGQVIATHSDITERSIKETNNKDKEIYDKTEPICQLYSGSTCLKFFQGQFVYIPYTQSQSTLEEKLAVAFNVIKLSKELSPNCEDYALPSLCYSTFPVCRQPNDTNYKFFQELANADGSISDFQVHFENLPSSGIPAHLIPNTGLRISREVIMSNHEEPALDKHAAHSNSRLKRQKNLDNYFDTNQNIFKGYGDSRNSIPLRRLCKQDCEILENELCQKEYAIAKRHPHIGQQLTLEECIDLPEEEPDCLDVGLEKEMGTDDDCFWESGVNYRGKVNTTSLGFPCIKWSHQLRMKLNPYPELAGGHNYCRNPGSKEQQPWCFVETEMLEQQPCDIPKCSHRIWIYIISSILSLCLLLFIFVVCVCCRHKPKDGTNTIRNINLPNADKNIYGNSRLNSPIELSDLVSNQNSIPPVPGRSPRLNGQIRVPQYSLSQIKFVEELGEGAFGKVYKGELQRGSESLFVAVKALKENASAKTQADFRREIDLISDLRHDNIVCIVGVALREEPLCMLFEFMSRGDLHEFLMGRAPPSGCGLPPLRLLTIAHHIASGMEYLAGHHYVHRDLAARNCLVADNFVVKISDFGLSRDIYSSDYYRVQSKSLLPVRWMPPESILYGKFTTESDIWSYGVVLWEIYSYGLQPYYGYSNQEVIAMVRGGELLGCPFGCPAPLYSLMRECWRQQSPRRPRFDEINSRLAAWINMGGCSAESGLGVSDSSVNSSMAGGSNSVVGNSSHIRQATVDRRERVPLLDSSSGSLRKFSSSECGDSLPRPHIKKGSCGSLLDTRGLERASSRSTTVNRLE